ncbi:ester cyclase [Aureimonas mangrovi]|uniref:ester cyclase n=1 Tax=Aureimonas mangrovi TaxID=2758041 RepID=UPI00163D5322|nr:ester cyclase [Aureimonas mangrovi]
MAETLKRRYRAYLDCLNRQAWDELDRHVSTDVHHNGQPLGVDGYRDMLLADFEAIPDLRFEAERIVCDPPHVAARLLFRCTPRGEFLGLPVNGRTVSFGENAFYEFADGRISAVWSVIDKAAIEAQL